MSKPRPMRPSHAIYELGFIEDDLSLILSYIKGGCFEEALRALDKTKERLQRLRNAEEIARKEAQEAEEALEEDDD